MCDTSSHPYGLSMATLVPKNMSVCCCLSSLLVVVSPRMYDIQPIGNSIPPLLTSGIHRPRSSDRSTVMVWDEAKKDITLIVISIVAPIHYGKDIKSTIFDDDFIEEMQMISVEHGFLGEDDSRRTRAISWR